jgi:hypothetical protein
MSKVFINNILLSENDLVNVYIRIRASGSQFWG